LQGLQTIYPVVYKYLTNKAIWTLMVLF